MTASGVPMVNAPLSTPVKKATPLGQPVLLMKLAQTSLLSARCSGMLTTVLLELKSVHTSTNPRSYACSHDSCKASKKQWYHAKVLDIRDDSVAEYRHNDHDPDEGDICDEDMPLLNFEAGVIQGIESDSDLARDVAQTGQVEKPAEEVDKACKEA